VHFGDVLCASSCRLPGSIQLVSLNLQAGTVSRAHTLLEEVDARTRHAHSRVMSTPMGFVRSGKLLFVGSVIERKSGGDPAVGGIWAHVPYLSTTATSLAQRLSQRHQLPADAIAAIERLHTPKRKRSGLRRGPSLSNLRQKVTATPFPPTSRSLYQERG
jgi:hypothetical protein